MPATNVSRDDAVTRLFTVFRDQGYDGASLAELAKVSGLGKSSLYHYFPGGKEDMALAVLAYGERWLDEHGIAALQSSGAPRTRIQRMIDALDELYDGGSNPCLLGSLLLGASRAIFQERLHAIFEKWIDALAAVLHEAGISRVAARERSEDAIARIEGALILAGGLGDPAPFRRITRRLPKELLSARPPS